MGQFDFGKTEFKVEGFAELYKALDGIERIPKAIGLEPLLIKALTPMSLVAASIAPDDPATAPPYDLKSSIAVSSRQRTGRSKQDRALGQYDARAYMGPTKYGYPQAVMMEFGTVHATAQPYMRPAWDSGKQGALEIIKDGFAAQVQATARRYAVSPSP